MDTPTVDALIDYALACDEADVVADVRVGLGYSAVKLGSGKCGVACMLRHRLDRGTCSLLSQAGTIAGAEVKDVVPLLRSQNVIEASLGLAAINALVNQDAHSPSQENIDLVDLLQVRPADRVGMVGFIGPVAQQIQQRVAEFFVFDEGKIGQDGVTDVTKEAEILPTCDVAIVSATSLLNHTFDALRAMVSRAREVCLIGPSTPLLSEFFQARGVTVLAGRHVTQAEKMLQIVSEAGGTKRFGKVTKKVNLALR